MRTERAQLPERNPAKFLHVSSYPVHLPLFGVDPQADEHVRRGEIRDVQTVTLEGGKEIRVGRTLGRSYRRYPKGRTRVEWREIERML